MYIYIVACPISRLYFLHVLVSTIMQLTYKIPFLKNNALDHTRYGNKQQPPLDQNWKMGGGGGGGGGGGEVGVHVLIINELSTDTNSSSLSPSSTSVPTS